MANWTRPEKGVHVFVVLRHDVGIVDPMNGITATKAYATLDRAEAEVDRLNDINGDKGARYFVRVARYVDDPTHFELDAEDEVS